MTAARLTGDVEKDIKILSNQVFQLEEQMRYQLRNLDVTNFNDLGLARYENGRLQIYAEQVKLKTDELRVEIGAQTNQMQAQITANKNEISAVVTSVGDENGKVTAASIVAAINEAGSTVKISADHVDITGDFVTFTDLRGSGTTIINGDNIITGQIKGVNFIAKGDITGDGVTNSFVVVDDLEFLIGKVGYAWQYDEEDFKRSPKLYLMTEEFYDGAYTYRPSVKIFGAGGVSIETAAGMNPVFISSGYYLTLDSPVTYIRDNYDTEWQFRDGGLYKNGTKVL